jgi:Gas vesicle synthesis protein GvpL/GvpF
VADDLAGWAARRAPDLLARAEAQAVAALRDALLRAALRERAATTEPAPAPAAPAPAPAAPEPGELLWSYCVLRAREPAPPDLHGVASGAVERVEAGDLAALIGRVPASEFAAGPLRRNLNDLPWLERVARAHEAVLEQAMRIATIVPLRMCTLYEGEDGVRRMLERERETLADALELLEGRQEWGVKLLVDPRKLAEEARAGSHATADVEDKLATRGEGGAYMLRRRMERHVRDAADALAAEVGQQVHARFHDWAADAVTLPAQNRDLSGHEGEMLLNGAYLVEADRVEGLRALASELEGRHQRIGARIELTGPWPPYNFVPRAGTAAIA